MIRTFFALLNTANALLQFEYIPTKDGGRSCSVLRGCLRQWPILSRGLQVEACGEGFGSSACQNNGACGGVGG